MNVNKLMFLWSVIWLIPDFLSILQAPWKQGMELTWRPQWFFSTRMGDAPWTSVERLDKSKGTRTWLVSSVVLRMTSALKCSRNCGGYLVHNPWRNDRELSVEFRHLGMAIQMPVLLQLAPWCWKMLSLSGYLFNMRSWDTQTWMSLRILCISLGREERIYWAQFTCQTPNQALSVYYLILSNASW
jgi:hypothetical protein